MSEGTELHHSITRCHRLSILNLIGKSTSAGVLETADTRRTEARDGIADDIGTRLST